MNCRCAVRLLCLDAGGDLGPRQSSAVADHLVICTACRVFRGELSDALETARSLEPPSWEHGGEELRRRVWSQIRRDRQREDTRKAAGFGLVAAAAAFSAAVLLFFSLLTRRPATDSRQVPPPDVPPAIAATVPPGPARESEPVSPVAPLPASALASRPRVDAREGGITRIEFRTPNPNVRIIWLVGQEAPETSPARSPGNKQEVS